MQGSDAQIAGAARRPLARWLLHDVVPLLEDLVAVSYPLRKPVHTEQLNVVAGDASQPDDLGKGMVRLVPSWS